MTTSLSTEPNPATEICVAGRLQPGAYACRRDFDRRDTSRLDRDGKAILVSALVTACGRADARGFSYGWAVHLGAIACPTCYPPGGPA